ncbi:MAG: hypothetical protein HKM04_10765 [Legionellales bacterium]|nr:hypothetical protein [Legionellales bacterium]
MYNLNYKKTSLALIALFCSQSLFANVTTQTFESGQTASDIQALVNFMTTSIGSLPLRVRNNRSGLAYTGSAALTINGKILPLSYYSSPAYWGEYVCTLPGNSCDVVDSYNSSNYTVNPAAGIAGDLQIERVNVSNGADIYDAATWQMAVQLAAINNVTGPGGELLTDIADNQTALLNYGSDGNADYGNGNVSSNQNRAATSAFNYNGNQISVPSNAFYYRMVPGAWFAYDPLYGTDYAKIVAHQFPSDNSAYKPGLITWQDWKPITGENAWGFLIGPLQTAWLSAQNNGQQYIDFHSLAVQNAINILYAFRHMQSQIGAVYYEPAGGEDNGGAPVSPYNVSVENNASTLAGLKILKSVLVSELEHQANLSEENSTSIKQAIKDIDIMIYGGPMPSDSHAPYQSTAGLLSFFKNNAYDAENGIFYQGGSANDPNAEKTWLPTVEPKAVDVNTWGITVLGQPTIDEMFSFGAAYQMWQNVKQWGGYYGTDNQLWGVGYSDQDGNSSAHPGQGIMSTEWTAGAINMTRALITQYGVIANSSSTSIYTPEQKSQAASYITSLTSDEQSMVAHLNTLRTDQYGQSSSSFQDVAPPNYTKLISLQSGQLGFVYASKRYDIPFGWWANPLPSTTSVAWPVMLYYNFNPFTLGGSYTAPHFAAPPLPETLNVQINNTSNGTAVNVNYTQLDGKKEPIHGSWPAPVTANSNGQGDIPAQTIMVALTNVSDGSSICKVSIPYTLYVDSLDGQVSIKPQVVPGTKDQCVVNVINDDTPPQNPPYLPATTTAYVSNQVQNATKIGINYGYWDTTNQTCNTTNLTYGPQLSGVGGTVSLPQNVCFVSVAYTVDNTNWYGACNVDSSHIYDIYGDAQGKNGVSTIDAIWTNSQGNGACPIEAPVN